jgi:Rieske Fe-S protein
VAFGRARALDPGLLDAGDMRHPRKLQPSRRSFCLATGAGLGAGLVLASLPACDPGTGERIGEGQLDSTGTGGSAGGGGGGHAGGGGGGGGGSAGGGGTGGGDMAGSPADMATGQSCTALPTSVGTASSYTVGGAPKIFNANGSKEFFVARDSGGLYAVSGICPHAGCPIDLNGAQFYCGCHGATFALDGSKPTSPAKSALKHFAMCVDASGNVTVNTSTTVAITIRY